MPDDADPAADMTDFKRYLPTRDQLKEIKSLRFLGELIFQPNLWHFNRHSVSFGVLIGIFCCFLPIPFQMVPATVLAVWIGCNIPVTIAMVWISNPFTMPPMMYFTYRVGCWILGEPEQAEEVAFTFEWLGTQFAAIWQPLLLGSVVCGLLFGGLAFLLVRLYWRWRVGRDWYERRLRRVL